MQHSYISLTYIKRYKKVAIDPPIFKLILKTAWDIFIQASHELSDGFDENKIHLYKDVITNVDGVKGIKEIKGRNYGNNEVIDVVILVNSTLDIKEAHDIATHVEKVMMKDHGVYDVHVHVEPN